MPQTGMFRMEDGTLRVPKWSCTLTGDLLAPELEAADDETDVPQISNPWSYNETRITGRLSLSELWKNSSLPMECTKLIDSETHNGMAPTDCRRLGPEKQSGGNHKHEN
jgi:hypothetical protein